MLTFTLWQLLAIPMMALGAYAFCFNWSIPYFSKKFAKHISCAPLLAPLFLIPSMLAFEITRPFAWIGLFDLGTLELREVAAFKQMNTP